jgi:hypothetical protein
MLPLLIFPARSAPSTMASGLEERNVLSLKSKYRHQSEPKTLNNLTVSSRSPTSRELGLQKSKHWGERLRDVLHIRRTPHDTVPPIDETYALKHDKYEFIDTMHLEIYPDNSHGSPSFNLRAKSAVDGDKKLIHLQLRTQDCGEGRFTRDIFSAKFFDSSKVNITLVNIT